MKYRSITEVRDQLNDVKYVLSFVGGAVGSTPLTEDERLGAQIIIHRLVQDLGGTSQALEKFGLQYGSAPS